VARLADPLLALSPLKGLVVLDEVQRRPELFPTLRVLADRRPRPARFLVLGSASPGLLHQSSESLAGRIAYYELPGLSLAETGPRDIDLLWLRGGFPLSFTTRSHAASQRWRQDFVRTFLERDIPQFGIAIPSAMLERFWSMLAHYHAQTWNGSELARAFGVSHHVMRRYLDVLEATIAIERIRAISKRRLKRRVDRPAASVIARARPGLPTTLLTSAPPMTSTSSARCSGRSPAPEPRGGSSAPPRRPPPIRTAPRA